jgi:cystathionine gamma-synthase
MVYARLARPTGSRLEHVLTTILKGKTLVYSSGLSAIHAYLVRLGPNKVAIGGGYHGTHAVLDIHHRLSGTIKIGLDEVDSLEAGDVIHLESPLNPTGEARNIAVYSKIAKEKGLYLVVDSTFGPPALQDPFKWGADIVVHSGTKYMGGHSDIMCGILAVQREDLYMGLWEDRCALGNLLGGFESWLGLRSLRTLDIRCQRQSENCTALVKWMTEMMEDEKPNEVNLTVQKMTHASLQKSDMTWLVKQMPGGFGPVFGLIMKKEKFAQWLPSKLRIFQHATSLGGVESLIEWRRMSDHAEEGNVLRISVGIETLEDLKNDLLNGFRALMEDKRLE